MKKPTVRVTYPMGLHGKRVHTTTTYGNPAAIGPEIERNARGNPILDASGNYIRLQETEGGKRRTRKTRKAHKRRPFSRRR